MVFYQGTHNPGQQVINGSSHFKNNQIEARSDAVKSNIAQEPGMLGPMLPLQGKLEVVKQEMARVNFDILGISELKWTGVGEFNSDDHYIYYSGQESLRRNGVAIIANK